MSQRPGWLDGTYEDALRLVAERAVFSRAVGGLTKHASRLTGLDNKPLEALKRAAADAGKLDALMNDPAALKALAGGR